MSNPFITYFEAEATSINIAKQRAICESVKVVKSSNPLKTFCVPYDYLVLGVGEMPATFGTPGVRENCFFMKEVRDSVAIRNRISTQVRVHLQVYDTILRIFFRKKKSGQCMEHFISYMCMYEFDLLKVRSVNKAQACAVRGGGVHI